MVKLFVVYCCLGGVLTLIIILLSWLFTSFLTLCEQIGLVTQHIGLDTVFWALSPVYFFLYVLLCITCVYKL